MKHLQNIAKPLRNQLIGNILREKHVQFYDILSNQLQYDSLNKRHRLYHILVHQYFRLEKITLRRYYVD